MSKVQTLRAFVEQRLSLAAEEIFELFERTIAEYEEQLCRQNKLLDAGSQLLVSKDQDPPEQQDWSSSLDQVDPPEPPHIKEEQGELWTNQELEGLQGPEEVDITKFIFTPATAKIDDDGERKSDSSKLSQTEEMKTEAGGEDCGGPGPGPARDCDPGTHLQPATDDKTLGCSELQPGDSWVWGGTGEPQSGSNSLSEPVGDLDRTESFSCPQQNSFKIHMRIHSEEKRFCCSFCNRAFKRKQDVKRHIRVHTGEKPFGCSVCNKRFSQRAALVYHSRIHTGEKPFVCLACEASFSDSSSFSRHMKIHTGERPHSCSVCSKRFSRKGHLKQHMTVHTREKCSLQHTEQKTL